MTILLLGIKKGKCSMKNLFGALLSACLIFQAGCTTPQQHTGPKVSVIDTIEGQEHVISAQVEEDGKFKSSITKDGRTQTVSGQVRKSDDKYLVTVDYSSTKVAVPGLRQVRSTVSLGEGESQNIGGVGNDVVSVKISN
jgi:hypothetical protein